MSDAFRFKKRRLSPRCWIAPVAWSTLILSIILFSVIAYLVLANTRLAHAASPTITNIAPTEGLTTGGTQVTITGTDFRQVTHKQLDQISAGIYHALAIDTEGSLYGWGLSVFGQVGDGTTSSPVWVPKKVYDVNTGIMGSTDIGIGTKITQVSVGQYHSMAIDEKGNLFIWGHGQNNQLGTGSNANIGKPHLLYNSATGVFGSNNLGAGTKIVNIAGGWNHSMAVDSNGDLYTWGNYTAIGNGNSNPYVSTPGRIYSSATGVFGSSNIGVGTKIVDIAAGSGHSMATDSNGNLYSWGSDPSGANGNGNTSTATILAPQQIYNSTTGLFGLGSQTDFPQINIGAGTKIASISASSSNSMATDDKGNLYLWGSDGAGQIGNGNTSTADVTSPQQIYNSTTGQFGLGSQTDFPQINIGAGTKIVNATLGENHVTVMDENSNMYLWGSDGAGQIGNGDTSTADVTSPQQIYNSTTGQLGLGSQTDFPVINLDPSTKLAQISAGSNYSTTIDENGNLYAWGADNYGQMGNGPTISTSFTSPQSLMNSGDIAPTIVSNITSIKLGDVECTNINITSDTELTCTSLAHPYGTVDATITTIDNQTITISDAFTYKLPLPTITSIEPTKGPTAGGTEVTITGTNFNTRDGHITQVASGTNHTLLLDSNGDIWAFGLNNYGQLGNTTNNGTSTSNPTPTKVEASVKFVQISAGPDSSMAIDTNGDIWGWGLNTYGQLGHNNNTSTNNPNPTPTKVEASVKFVELSASNHILAKDTGGGLWAWGNNYYGQLGHNNNTGTNNPNPTPTQVGLYYNATQFLAGSDHSIIIDIYAYVWTWGSNQYGQLGYDTNSGTTNANPTPAIAYPGSADHYISGKGFHSLAIDYDNNTWAWGRNQYGQLGFTANTTANYTPTRLDLSVVFSQISSGLNSNLAIDIDGDIWTWGSNLYGELGNETNVGVDTANPTPTKLNYDIDISQVSVGGNHNVILDTNNEVWTWGRNDYGQIGDALSSGTNDPHSVPTKLTIDELAPYSTISSVTFGGQTCTSLTVVSDTKMTCTVPTNSAGLVDVELTTLDNQTATEADAFEYIPPPTITAVNPNSGVNTGGTTITLTGTGLTYLEEVLIDTETCTSLAVVSDTEATCETPPYVGYGTADITATNTLGESTEVLGGFTYTLPLPTITNIDPNKGPTAGGTEVTITGTNFISKTEFTKVIAGGAGSSIALDSAGNVYTWGVATNGQLGNGATTGTYYDITNISADASNALYGKRIIDIAFNYNNAFAIDSDGNVYAWGYPNYGVLGNNTTSGVVSSPINISAIPESGIYGKKIIQIAVGFNHALAIDEDGNIYSWGTATSGVLGNGTTSGTVLLPTDISTRGSLSGKTIVSVSASRYASFAIDQNGQVHAWGNGGSHRLGINSTASTPTPVNISTLTTNDISGVKITKVVATSESGTAIDENGNIYSWGWGANGVTGNGNTGTNLAIPTAISSVSGSSLNGKTIVDIAAGYQHVAALDSNGQVHAWGTNDVFALGNNGTSGTVYPMPANISTISGSAINGIKLTQINSSNHASYSTLGIGEDGNFYAWGRGADGMLGNGNTANAPMPVEVSTSSFYTQVLTDIKFGSGFCTSLTVISDEQATCITPAHSAGLVDVELTTIDNQTATEADGFEYIPPSTITAATPNSGANTGGTTITLTGTGLTHLEEAIVGDQTCTSLTITSDTEATCVTSAYSGYGTVDITATNSIGNSTTLLGGFTYTLPLPTIANVNPDKGPVTGGTEITITGTNFLYEQRVEIIDVAPGYNHVLTIDAKGNMYSWGYDGYGQVGNGNVNTNTILVPTKIYDVTTGLLGLGTQTDYPVLNIGIDTKIVKIAAGDHHSMAVDSNGNMYVWGRDNYGQLGNGAAITADIPSPMKVYDSSTGILGIGSDATYPALSIGAGTTIVDVKAGTEHSMAIDSNGNMYLWGYDGSGQIGNSNATSGYVINPQQIYNSTTGILGLGSHATYPPIDIGVGNRITTIEASENSSFAIDSNGDLYAWGSDANGKLGNGNAMTANIISPQRIHNSATGIFGLGTQAGFLPIDIGIGTKITDIKTSPNNSIAIDSNGNMYVWGSDAAGQIGNGNSTSDTATSPQQIYNSTTGQLGFGTQVDFPVLNIGAGVKIISIAFSTNSALATDSNGNMYSWGLDNYGQQGNGNSSTFSPTSPHKIYDSTTGQLGLGTQTDYPVLNIGAGTEMTMVFAGNRYASYAVDAKGKLYSWGYNGTAQVGNNTSSTSIVVTSPIDTMQYGDLKTTPVPVPARINVGGLECTNLNIISDTELTCTTSAHAEGLVDVEIITIDNQVATAEDAFRYVPPSVITEVTPNSGANAGGTSITLTGTGLTYLEEVLVDTKTCTSLTIISDTSATCITPSYDGYGAVDITATNNVGDSTTLLGGFTYTLPLPIITSIDPDKGPTAGGTEVTITGENFTLGFKEVESGENFTLALDAGGNLYSWGYNNYGQIGDGTTTNRQTPFQINGGVGSGVAETTKFKAIGTGYLHSLAIDMDGELWTWGGNANGALGNGAAGTSVLTPTKINTSSIVGWVAGDEFVAVSAGSNSSLALTKKGIVYAFGLSTNYQTGLGATTAITVPTKVNGVVSGIYVSAIKADTKIISIASGGYHSMAIDDAGNFYIWGDNLYRQAGNSTGTADQRVPLKVNGDTSATSYGVPESTRFKAIAGGQYHSMAVDTDGNLYTWGFNQYGAIGNGTSSSTVYQNTLYKVNGGSGSGIADSVRFEKVAAGIYFSEAIDTDGNLYTWGHNQYGQIGNGTSGTTSRLTPYKIPGNTYKDASGGLNHASSITTSGDIYMWGYGSSYQQGNGSTANQLTPTYLPIISPTITSVNFDGLECTNLVVVSATEMTCTTPAHSAGPVDVDFITIDNQTATKTDGFLYVAPPTITNVSPNEGLTTGGTEVTLTGTGFNALDTVRFGMQACTSLTIVSDTEATCITPANNYGVTDVTVINTVGDSAVLPGGFTYKLPLPTITSITPDKGPTAGGTEVTITGTNFMQPFASDDYIEDGLVAHYDGINNSRNGHVQNATTWEDLSGNGNDLTLYGTTAYTDWVQNGFLFQGNQFFGIAYDLTTGLPYGNSQYTLETNYYINSALAGSQVPFLMSLGLNTSGNLNSIALNQTSGANNNWGSTNTLNWALPNGSVAGVKHTLSASWDGTTRSGYTDGEFIDSNIITTKDTSNTSLYLGIRNGDTTNVTASNNIIMKSARIYNRALTAREVACNAAVDRIRFDGAVEDLSDCVKLLSAVSVVSVDGLECTNLTVVSATEMTCVTPAHPEDLVDVTITTIDNQTVEEEDAYLYIPPPAITSVNPNTGYNTGGETITLTGTGFTYLSSVLLGTETCTTLAIVSDIEATCVTPAHTDGFVDVTVTNTINNTAVLPDGFEFIPPWHINLTTNKPGFTLDASPIENISTDVVIATTETNWLGGYTLSVSQGEDGSDLICTEDTSLVLPTTTIDNSASLSTNSYGIGTGTVSTLPSTWRTVSTTPRTVGYSLADGTFIDYVYLGISVDLSQSPCDAYEGVLVFSAVMNP